MLRNFVSHDETLFLCPFLFPVRADLKAAPGSKYGRSPSMTTNPSPMGTPQRKAAETQQSQVGRFASLQIFTVRGLENSFSQQVLNDVY